MPRNQRPAGRRKNITDKKEIRQEADFSKERTTGPS
jgi:hypothetical protein